MIGTLIGIIFLVIIIGVLWWAAKVLMNLIPIAEPFKTIIYVILVVIGVFICLMIVQMLLAAGGISVPWPNLK